MSGIEARLILRDSGLPGWKDFEVATNGIDCMRHLGEMADDLNKRPASEGTKRFSTAIAILRAEKKALMFEAAAKAAHEEGDETPA